MYTDDDLACITNDASATLGALPFIRRYLGARTHMTGQDFKTAILELFYQDIHHIQADNFAAERFNYDGVDRSRIFDAAQHARALEWFISNAPALFEAWSFLADETSRELYTDLIRYRLSGHMHFKIRSRIPLLKDAAAKFRTLFAGQPSQLVAPGLFGDLMHYEIPWAGAHYSVDTYRGGLVFGLIYGQYYFNRGTVRIAPEAGDHVIDGGACTGDSSVLFAKSVGPRGKVYAFDPVQNHIEICKYNFAQPDLSHVKLFEFGLSDRNADGEPVRLATSHPGFNVGSGEAVPLRRIDDLVATGEIERIDFIKMDIEGSELPALTGAVSALHTFRPKLAISLYHRPNDLFEIITFLRRQQLGYAFYIDHYTIHNEETVLYAVATG